MMKIALLAGILYLFTSPAFSALKLSDDDLRDILKVGHWSSSIDDSARYYQERISAKTLQNWIANYNESDSDSIVGIGLMVLLTSIAEWGVVADKSLPDDPHKKEWMGPDERSDGKHLMSYAVGGIGINHTDSGELKELFDYLKVNHPNLAPNGDRFFKLRGINYDIIRANGGVCTEPRSDIMDDLEGKKFGHDKFPGGKKYCPRFFPKDTTTLEDWQIFRHWMRAALRQENIQRYIIERWLNKVWLPSYREVIKSGGTVEEAMVNARIRNSSSVTARCAIKKAVLSANRIESQLAAYTSKECRGDSGHSRRFGSMDRPVKLYRHFRSRNALI